MNSLRLSWIPLITAVFLLGCGETKPPEPPESPESPESQLISGFNPTDGEESQKWLHSLWREIMEESNPLIREALFKRINSQLNALRNTKVFWKQKVYYLYSADSHGEKAYFMQSYLPVDPNVYNLSFEYYDYPSVVTKLRDPDERPGMVMTFRADTRPLSLDVYKTLGNGEMVQTEAVIDRAELTDLTGTAYEALLGWNITIYFRHLRFIAPSE